MGWGSFFKSVAPFVAPVVAIAAPELLPVVGESLGLTGSAAAAADVGALSAGSTLAAGGTPKQALKSGAAGAAGGYAGAELAPELGATGGAAAGGAASGGTSAALNNQDVLKGAAKGAVISGGSQAATSGISDLVKDYRTAQAQQPGYVGDINYGFTPTTGGGGVGLKATVDTTPYNADGTVNYNLAVSSGEPGLKATPSTSGYELAQETGGGQGIKGQPADAFSPPTGLSPETQRALRSTIAAGLASLFPTGRDYTASQASLGSQGPVSGEQVSTGTTQGLSAERSAGEIEGTETGGKRRNVWNEESLRLKDALGI